MVLEGVLDNMYAILNQRNSRRAKGEDISEELLAEMFQTAQARTLAQYNYAPEALARYEAEKIEGVPYSTKRDGVGILSVHGPIFRRANMMTRYSGAVSTGMLAQAFNQLHDRGDIRSILLDVDSPGGDANAIGEFADMIYEARQMGRKKIATYSGGQFCSAAYYIGAPAERLTVSKSSIVGSIGVVARARRPREGDDLEIVSSQSPDKRVDVSKDEGVEKIRATCTSMAQVFIEDVARYRGVKVKKVLADFGRGGVLVGREAVTAGMADRLGTFEGALTALHRRLYPVGGAQTAAAGEAASGPSAADMGEFDMVLDLLNKFKRKKSATVAQESDEEEDDLGGAEDEEDEDVDVDGDGADDGEESEEDEGEDEQAGADKKKKVAAKAGAASPKAAAGKGPKKAAAGHPAFPSGRRFMEEDELDERFADSALRHAMTIVGGQFASGAEQEPLCYAYLQALKDDYILGGEVAFFEEGRQVYGTRVQMFDALNMARPKSTLTQRRLKDVAKGRTTARARGAMETETMEVPEAVGTDDELLAQTPQGRAVLAARESKNGNGHK
jgi:ClpP class serine protease